MRLPCVGLQDEAVTGAAVRYIARGAQHKEYFAIFFTARASVQCLVFATTDDTSATRAVEAIHRAFYVSQEHPGAYASHQDGTPGLYQDWTPSTASPRARHRTQVRTPLESRPILPDLSEDTGTNPPETNRNTTPPETIDTTFPKTIETTPPEIIFPAPSETIVPTETRCSPGEARIGTSAPQSSRPDDVRAAGVDTPAVSIPTASDVMLTTATCYIYEYYGCVEVAGSAPTSPIHSTMPTPNHVAEESDPATTVPSLTKRLDGCDSDDSDNSHAPGGIMSAVRM